MRILFLVLFVSAVLASRSEGQVQAPPSLMPLPAKMQTGSGRLLVDAAFSVAVSGHREARLDRAVELFLGRLRQQTGMLPLVMKATASPPASLVVQVEAGARAVQELDEDESYQLQVTSAGARLTAATTLGAMRGLQTFLQLVQMTAEGFAAPAVTIEDRPRFPWRGLLIDPGRHFIPVEVVKRNLDGMAAVKLNVLHWHLSDYQGFRIESKRFPKLHELGSDGLYYTQAEISDVISYARERGIRVVPEFDMPGHSTSWFVGYPELASSPGPYELARKWGVLDPAMDPTREETYKFLDKFIGEMAKIFPDKFFHIGGDEVNGKQWDANTQIQAFMKAHGLKDNADLQAYFNRRIEKILNKYGKTMLGWDEILRPDLPNSIVIQSWRGPDSLAQAVKLGYRGLLSSGYYIDLMWPAARHYATEPMSGAAAQLTPDQQKQILGGEVCMWGEYVSAENIDSRIWPRTAAIAERFWSSQDVTDVASMYRRMADESLRLAGLGLTHKSVYPAMLRRMAGGEDISALKDLGDVVEPVKDYTREDLATTPATSTSALNRMVDAVPPESLAAREFGALVDQLVAGTLQPGTESRIRNWLNRWQRNQEGLQPLLATSLLAKETGPLSQSLSALGATGLAALDYLDHGAKAPAGWVAEQLALVEQAKKPQAQLMIMVAPAVGKLVQFSGGASLEQAAPATSAK